MLKPDPKGGSDWFESLKVKGDFKPETLDHYFETVQAWLKDDMRHLRQPIVGRRRLSNWVRFAAFAAVALGVLLPLPIFPAPSDRLGGLELGYLAVLLGGLVLLLDRVFNISGSWMRLTLAEMQIRQVRYRLDLDWAKRRPELTEANAATHGPILIEILRVAMDLGQEIMEKQRETWTNELQQAMEALQGRLDADRLALQRLRTERDQEKVRPKTGAINLTVDKPGDLKGPLVIKVGGEEKVRMDAVPAHASVNGVPVGLQTVDLIAVRKADGQPFAYSVTETVAAGEAKAIAVSVG